MEKPTEKLNIICFSNQLWNFPLWTNKKHVMTRLAKQGHNILFVDPPINTGRLFLRQLLAKKWPLKRLTSLQYKDENVTILSPLYPFPSYDFFSQKYASFINDWAQKNFDKNLKTVLWVYNVEIEGIEHYLKIVKHDVLVYDCVDNYAGFPKYNTPEKKEKVNNQEKYLTQNANVVFASAPGLVDKLKKYNTNVHFTPNVGDYEKFSKVKEYKDNLPDDLQTISRPRIGFTGAVDEYKFDKVLVKKLAQDYPNYSFVIIGPLGLKDRDANIKELGFENLHNVYFLGTKDYLEMPKYCAGFDVFIIPYVLNDYTVGGCFPVKFHEALAAGIPTVVTDLPSYKPFSNVCYISKTHNEFSQNIRRALEENNEAKTRERQIVAKDNNWDGKVARMLSLINEFLSK